MDRRHCIQFSVLSCKRAYSAYSSVNFVSEAGQFTAITDNKKTDAHAHCGHERTRRTGSDHTNADRFEIVPITPATSR
jgi:hypothetical protein